MTLEASKEWATVPWEISGEELPVSPWRKFVWKERRKLYIRELLARRDRDNLEIQNRINDG